MFALCLDWNYVGAGGGAIGSLFTPLSTQVSLYAGVVVCMCGPSSPSMRTRQSSRMRAALSIAAKKRGPTCISREVMDSASSGVSVKRSKKMDTMDCRVETACLDDTHKRVSK